MQHLDFAYASSQKLSKQKYDNKAVALSFQAMATWQFAFKDEMNYNSIELKQSAKFEII